MTVGKLVQIVTPSLFVAGLFCGVGLTKRWYEVM